jgi:asparagine synthase (glutamine-hydrolysing)
VSGIFGIYQHDGGPVGPATPARLADSLAALGCDGYSQVASSEVSFGHLLMNRTPRERTPCKALFDESRDLLFTGDLRLDNRSDLAAKLEIGFDDRQQISDSELVLRAYRRWGVECSRHLLGDFAFAIWDQRQRRLLLVRDHFGVRPLFYAKVGSSFFFASAMRGLLDLPDVPLDLDETMLARYLIYASCSAGPTPYRAIQSLIPSHTMVIEADGEPRIESYWKPDPGRRVYYKDERDYVDRYRELLSEAVATRIDPGSRTGVLVSGGLDSSAITALAASRDTVTKLVGVGHVTQLDSPAADLDERRYLEALAGSLPKLEMRYTTASGGSPLAPVEQVFESLRLPVQWAPNYVQKALFEEAREASCDVLLTGIGGDEVASFNSPRYLACLLGSLKLGRFAKEYAAEREELDISNLRLWRQLALAQLPRKVWHALSHQRHGYLGVLDTCIGEDFAREVDLRTMLNASLYWDATSYQPPSTRAILQGYIMGLADEGVDNHNWVTEAADYNLSLRFPLIDVRLVEYCLAVPSDQHRRAGVGRRLIRSATKHLLPDLVRLRRDKGEFGPDFLLRTQEDLDRIRQGLGRQRTTVDLGRYVDYACLEQAADRIERATPEGPDPSYDGRALLLPAYYLGRFLELLGEKAGSSL